MAVHLKASLRNAMLDLVNAAIGASGFFRIYSGAQPTDADTALGAQVKLAELALSATAFAAAGSGSIVMNTVTDDLSADATGTAAWGTITKSDGTRVIDFSVTGTGGGGDVEISSTSIVAGVRVSVTSFSLSAVA